VDAVSRQEFWDVLTDLKGGDLTILVSTPYMDEAIRCDRVALIDQGSILKVDHPEAIGEAYEWPLLAVQGPDRYRLLRDLRTYDHARSVFPFGEDIHVTDERKDGDPDQLSDELRAWLHEKGHPETTVRPISADIEDAFMALMGDANETATPPSLNDALA
jgi:ABC-type multidrug transport system ATPase subunit